MQEGSGSPAVNYLGAARACMELYLSCTCASFRWVLPSTLRGSDGLCESLSAELLDGWARHVATHAPEGSAQHARALERVRDRGSAAAHLPFDNDPLAAALDGPLLLLAAPYGNDAELSGEWVEHGDHAHCGVWRRGAQVATHGTPRRPSPLLICDDEQPGHNDALAAEADAVLASLARADVFNHEANAVCLSPQGCAAVRRLMAVGSHDRADNEARSEPGASETLGDGARRRTLPQQLHWPPAPLASRHFGARNTFAPTADAMAAYLLPPSARWLLRPATHAALSQAGLAGDSDSEAASAADLSSASNSEAETMVPAGAWGQEWAASALSGSTEAPTEPTAMPICVRDFSCKTCSVIHHTNRALIVTARAGREHADRAAKTALIVQTIEGAVGAALHSELGPMSPIATAQHSIPVQPLLEEHAARNALSWVSTNRIKTQPWVPVPGCAHSGPMLATFAQAPVQTPNKAGAASIDMPGADEVARWHRSAQDMPVHPDTKSRGGAGTRLRCGDCGGQRQTQLQLACGGLRELVLLIETAAWSSAASSNAWRRLYNEVQVCDVQILSECD